MALAGVAGRRHGLGPDLWRLFGARVAAALKERGVKSGARLLWLPTGALGIAAGAGAGPCSPSAVSRTTTRSFTRRALNARHRRNGRSSAPQPLLWPSSSTRLGTCPAPRRKAGSSPRTFRPRYARSCGRSAAPDAVLAALKGKCHWHFASHGIFSWEDARQSALVMHGQARLNVGRLLETTVLAGRALLCCRPARLVSMTFAATPTSSSGCLAPLRRSAPPACWALCGRYLMPRLLC